MPMHYGTCPTAMYLCKGVIAALICDLWQSGLFLDDITLPQNNSKLRYAINMNIQIMLIVANENIFRQNSENIYRQKSYICTSAFIQLTAIILPKT